MDKLLSDEELRIEIGELFDAGSNLKARAGHTIEAEFQYKKFSVDKFEAIINTQKRLYAESIVGKDFIGCGCKDADLICDHEIQNELRAEQRARIDL